MKKVAIIGAGPAGMAAALYLKRAGMEPILIDKSAPGGDMLKISNLENYLGFDKISGSDLALKMVSQLNDHRVNVVFGDVDDVILSDNKFTVKTENFEYVCDNVIIAIGKVANKLGLAGEDKFIGRGISYCSICDGSFYKNQDVAVVGGGNSAFTDALYLAGLCRKVYVIIRGDIKAEDVLQSRVRSFDNVVLVRDSYVTKIIGDDKVEGISLSNGTSINVSGIFVAIGGKPDFSFLDNLDIKNKDGFILTDEKMMTSVPGLYAAGDCVYKDFHQIVTAINDGVIAALNIGKEN